MDICLITLQRGSKHGCSAPLYRESIKGIRINGEEHKVALCADDVLVHKHICEPNKTFSSGYKVHKTQLNIELQTSETTVKNSLMDQHSVKCLVFICQKTSLDWQKLNMLPYSIRLKIKEGGVPQLEPHCVNMNLLLWDLDLLQPLPVETTQKDFH